VENREPVMTKGVATLLGDPKRAIKKIAVPMMFGMFFQSIYNIADGIWVAGLGADELAAVGLFMPFFMIILSLGAGIGVGGSSAVSRRIGRKDKKGADNTSVHTLIIGLIISVALTLLSLPFMKHIFTGLSGSEKIGALATQYGLILFSGSVVLIFSNIANALLRGEGDARRAMYGLIVGSVLNIVLDPIFIYVLGLGVAGAAWASLISMIVAALLFIYWLFIKRDTYLNISLSAFKYNTFIISDIFRVGIPSSFAQLSMAIAMLVVNKIVVLAGGTDGIAVFTSGWRIVMLGTIPLMGIAMSVVAVTGAAFGAKEREKLKTAFYYALKMGVLIELIIGVLVLIFANQIAVIFTYSKGSSRIYVELVKFLRIITIIFPTVPLGMLTSAMFRGVGKGSRSLIVTLLRTILLQVPLAYIFGIIFHWGLTGVWSGLICANLIAVVASFLWGKHTVNTLPFDTR